MKLILRFILTLSVSAALAIKIDYCWRDYHGDVPEDAIQAGLDNSGKPIYIGQGFFVQHGLLPGTLHAGSTNLKVTAVKKVFNTDKFVKILCSRRPHNFNWISVESYSDISRLTDVHLVEGGTETNTVVYIGRVLHEENLEIGKIYNLAPHQGLVLPNREGAKTSYQAFDILTYHFNELDVRHNSNCNN